MANHNNTNNRDNNIRDLEHIKEVAPHAPRDLENFDAERGEILSHIGWDRILRGQAQARVPDHYDEAAGLDLGDETTNNPIPEHLRPPPLYRSAASEDRRPAPDDGSPPSEDESPAPPPKEKKRPWIKFIKKPKPAATRPVTPDDGSPSSEDESPAPPPKKKQKAATRTPLPNGRRLPPIRPGR